MTAVLYSNAARTSVPGSPSGGQAKGGADVRSRERRASRMPLIAGAIAIAAAIALAIAPSRTAHQADSADPVVVVAPVSPPTPSDARLIAPAAPPRPAPVIREQARIAPAPATLDARESAHDASATAPAPAPVAIPEPQAASPEALAVPAPTPAPAPVTPEAVAVPT